MLARREMKYSYSAAVAFGATMLRALTLLALVSTGARAADDRAVEAAPAAKPGAREVLADATQRVLAVIEDARSYVNEDPERYYAEVDKVLDSVVDFKGFARGVMGEYGTSARYRSLDEAGRNKLRDQLERFTKTMRQGLIRTYSKGLLAFGGSRVELDDSDDSAESGDRVMLRQLIYSDASEPYVVVYQMARDRSGTWRMRNLVVENVNLGQIYRSQFESAARRYDGDLDKVIDNWSSENAQVK